MVKLLELNRQKLKELCLRSQSELEVEDCGVGEEGLRSDCVWAVEWDMLRGVDEDSSDVMGEGVSGNSTLAEEFEGTIADVSRLVGNKEVLSDETTDWETLTEDDRADVYCNSEFTMRAKSLLFRYKPDPRILISLRVVPD